MKKSTASNFWFALIMLSASFLLQACGTDDLYFEKFNIETETWSQHDSLQFTFEVQDTSLLYNLYLIADFEPSFRSQNLYLKIQTAFPHGKKSVVIRSFDFFDAKGNVNGKCSSNQCNMRTFLQENAFFNLVGDYTITVHQYSREAELIGIKAIGIEVERGKKRRSE